MSIRVSTYAALRAECPNAIAGSCTRSWIDPVIGDVTGILLHGSSVTGMLLVGPSIVEIT